MHHITHLIVLTPDRQTAVRLCDGGEPDWGDRIDVGRDTVSTCAACMAQGALVRPVGGR